MSKCHVIKKAMCQGMVDVLEKLRTAFFDISPEHKDFYLKIVRS